MKCALCFLNTKAGNKFCGMVCKKKYMARTFQVGREKKEVLNNGIYRESRETNH